MSLADRITAWVFDHPRTTLVLALSAAFVFGAASSAFTWVRGA